MECFILDLNDSKSVETKTDGSEYRKDGLLIPHIGCSEWDGHIYVSGATGSGKTWLIGQILANDKLRRIVHYYSDLEDDVSLQLLYDQGRIIKTNSTNLDDVKDSIVLFDDCTNSTLMVFRDQLLERGRHQNTMVVCVNHKYRQWRATMIPLNESRWVITFPFANKPTSVQILQGIGVNKNDAKDIVNQVVEDGRHMAIHQFAPNFILSTKSIIRI